MEQERELSPQESLQVIRQTIDLAKKNFQANGFHFLLWGWLWAFASLAQFYLYSVVKTGKHPMVWLVMVVVGVPVAFIYEYKKSRRGPSKNIINQWHDLVWLGFVISLGVAIFTAVAAGLPPTPFVLMLAAFATFVSGILLRFRPLIYGAAFIWAAAFCCNFLSVEMIFLAQTVAAVVGYLIPGYLLNKQSKNHVQ